MGRDSRRFNKNVYITEEGKEEGRKKKKKMKCYWDEIYSIFYLSDLIFNIKIYFLTIIVDEYPTD